MGYRAAMTLIVLLLVSGCARLSVPVVEIAPGSEPVSEGRTGYRVQKPL